LETIREAYAKYVLPKNCKSVFNLLVDGGSENNNEVVEAYLQEKEVSVMSPI